MGEAVRKARVVRSGCVYFLLCRSCGQCSEIEMEIKFQFKSEMSGSTGVVARSSNPGSNRGDGGQEAGESRLIL